VIRWTSKCFFVALLALAAGPAPAQTAAPEEDFSPHLNGSLTLRYQDSGPNLDAGQAKPYFNALWYGGELKDVGALNYNARIGVSGRLNEELAYGARLMFRNQKQAAFSYPAYEPGFGNSAVVADLFYFTVTPLQGLSIDLGKAPMTLVRVNNFFWDNDVSPTGITERYRLPLPGKKGNKSALLLTAGQWFPTPGFRNSPRTLVLVGQAAYQASYGGPRGLDVETAVGFTKFNGFDRFLAASNIGGATTSKLETDDGGDLSIVSVPKLDYAKDNDARVTGFNPLWVDLSLKVGLRSVGGHPLTAQLGYIHNFSAGPPPGMAEVLKGPGLNAFSGGVSYGKLKKRWDWSVRYAYEYKGMASVVNGWTDDGFGSDLKGHLVAASLMPIQDLDLSVQWRILQDADGRDRRGQALSPAFADAHYTDLRVALAAKF